MLNITDPTSITFKFWDNYPQDNPHLLNGFTGTFAFSDHSLIPEELTEFFLEYFYKKIKEGRNKRHIEQIDLGVLNDLINELWDGPGSMSKIVRMKYKLKANRSLETPLPPAEAIEKEYTELVDAVSAEKDNG
jgi:hypothetical protein|tara:strand:+ start:706 stop:1104 length:399 start_codon:yes stop_codon:yes gene_type:complete